MEAGGLFTVLFTGSSEGAALGEPQDNTIRLGTLLTILNEERSDFSILFTYFTNCLLSS